MTRLSDDIQNGSFEREKQTKHKPVSNTLFLSVRMCKEKFPMIKKSKNSCSKAIPFFYDSS